MTAPGRLLAMMMCGLLAAGAAYAAQTVVSQKDKMFDPEEVTLTVGNSLHIVNDDDVMHNVQVRDPDGNNENLGVQKAGEAVDVPFPKAGDYTVHCGIHPKMKLAVHAQ